MNATISQFENAAHRKRALRCAGILRVRTPQWNLSELQSLYIAAALTDHRMSVEGKLGTAILGRLAGPDLSRTVPTAEVEAEWEKMVEQFSLLLLERGQVGGHA